MTEPMGHSSPILDIRVARKGDVLVVGVSGELDMDTVPEVRAALALNLTATTSTLVLDLSEVVFFGSAGLSLLFEALRGADTFAVVATRRAVLRPIELTAVTSLVNVFPTVDEALAWAASTRHARRPG